MSKDANLLNGHLQESPAPVGRATLPLRASGRTVRPVRAFLLGVVGVVAALAVRPALAQVDLPEPDMGDPILVTAEAANHWVQGSYEVWLLRGNCQIRQGTSSARSQEAVLWIDRVDFPDRQPSRIIAYLEGDVTVDLPGEAGRARLTDNNWLGRFSTRAAIQVRAAVVAGKPDVMPAVYQRGTARRDPPPATPIRRTQYSAAAPPGPAPGGMPAGTRRIRAFSRGDVPVAAELFSDPATNQWIGVISSGVNLIVDGLRDFGSIDVSTDRLVIWTSGEPDLSGQKLQTENVPLEIYMEGNIVFRQGIRVIYADRMYYDVRNHVGTVINAEVLTPVPKYEGLVRLKTQLLQQTAPDRFFAQDSYFTSSRLGSPGYRIQAGDVFYQDLQRPETDPLTGQPVVDEAGQPVIKSEKLASGRNTFLFLDGIPVFYWPIFATDLSEPTYYIRRVRVKHDNLFGTQILTTWDGYQLLGIRNKPLGTDWELSLDYLSNRGLGHGTTFTYSRRDLFGVPGPYSGLADFWAVKDTGFDTLGSDRVHLEPEKDYRYRLFWQHRQQLPGDFQLSAEAGLISDRNFLEQFYKREWDELKDETTGVELKRTHDNVSWSITADMRLNPFFTQTEWLPRADHFWLGQPLVRDTFTWYEHSQVAFARLRTASTPTNPAEAAKFAPLPWEISRHGDRLATRQEIDWPFALGPVKVVPYALGEAAHWGEDLAGNDLTRVYGQTGVRASMPVWNVNPMVENGLWNVHGLAHKVVFDAEFSIAEANRSLEQLALYDPLDDDAIEQFRRRFAFNTFGGPPPVPRRFDERFYALRSGMASWVTAPSTEIADDLMALRMGVRQRWQTKRGMPGQRHIVDWITLDTNAVWFPNDTRDNFNRALGLADYDFRWHVGDRLTLVSAGAFDFFSQGQQVITLGGFLSRPPRGSLYMGLSLIDGPRVAGVLTPFHSQVLSMSYSYWMSPKWVSSFGMSVDVGGNGNIGQNLIITRIGESLLISAGFTIDASRGNVGANLAIEPRFLPKGRLGTVGGARIPVAGAMGLE